MEIELLILESHGKSWNRVFEFLWNPAEWVTEDPILFHADSEDSFQTKVMPRLICIIM